MRFEDLNMLQLTKYKGILGIPYYNTFEMLLIYLALIIIAVLALIGLFTILKMIIKGRKKKQPTTKKNPNWP